MGDIRLLFLGLAPLLAFAFLVLVWAKPRVVRWLVLICAGSYAPFLVTSSRAGQAVASVITVAMGALAIAVVLAPRLPGVRTVHGLTWRSAPSGVRVLLLVFGLLLGAGTVVTLISRARGAGAALGVVVWGLAAAAGYRYRGGSGYVPGQCAILAAGAVTLVAGLIASWVTGGESRSDVALSVCSIASFGAALAPGRSTYRLAFSAGATASVILLVYLYPDNQSLWLAVVVGSFWMLMVRVVGRVHLPANFHVFLAVLIVVATLAGPAWVFMVERRPDTAGVGPGVGVVVAAVGETESNLLDRPSRWASLLAAIGESPFHLTFIPASSLYYRSLDGVEGTAEPHNVLLTVGLWVGVPGLALALVMVVALLASVLRPISGGLPWMGPVPLSSIGVVAGLLFRNMWSNALLVFPIEIVLFSIALLSSWASQIALSRRMQSRRPGLVAGPASLVGGGNGW